ncbi:hypothetical protein EVJ58_g3548 [Rhodofomes roseus]|uniref:Uncharacterized protein n=1 Tax=Rhodofomes roseus TaxID=34475 RepID=A0A4Y9YK96_9APHY|nr:hypothetical protein EVJ58_g3548 [Rhodofomes roseus]
MYSKGNRPCLIVTYSGKGQDTVDTCVMGNLEGRNIDSMPLVFRHFCIPVAPNFGPNRTHMDVHIHTVPDWDARLGKAQWLITLPHALPAYMFRKKWTGAKRRSHHCVDADMISTLHRIRDQKDEEWSRWSKDPNFLSNARKEYKEHQAAHRNGRAQASLRTNSEVSLPTSFGRDSLDPVSEELLEEGAVEAILGLEGSCATMATQGAAPLAEGGDSNKDEARGISPTPSQQTVVDELSAASAPVTEPRKAAYKPVLMIPRKVLAAMHRRASRPATVLAEPASSLDELADSQRPLVLEDRKGNTDEPVQWAQPKPKRSLSRVLSRIPPLRQASGDSTASGGGSRTLSAL